MLALLVPGVGLGGGDGAVVVNVQLGHAGKRVGVVQPFVGTAGGGEGTGG
jgi:hypothetical protein